MSTTPNGRTDRRNGMRPPVEPNDTRETTHAVRTRYLPVRLAGTSRNLRAATRSTASREKAIWW